MQYPIEVILQRTDDTPEVEEAAFQAVGQLAQFCDHILGCQVFIRGPAASDDGVYVVNLKVRTPDCEITIAGARRRNEAHRELSAALRDAFGQAARELRALALPLCTCRVEHSAAASALHAEPS
jgi:hypothetical protein